MSILIFVLIDRCITSGENEHQGNCFDSSIIYNYAYHSNGSHDENKLFWSVCEKDSSCFQSAKKEEEKRSWYKGVDCQRDDYRVSSSLKRKERKEK